MPPRKKTETPKKIELNEEQQAVVSFREGYAQVLAGPGSGKSQCLVARFAALVEEGVSPDDILSLSFTRTAAKNLKDRVEARAGELSISRTGSGSATFHSLALNFVMEERNEFKGLDLAEFPLAAEPQANKLSSEAARRYEVDPRTLRAQISLWKRGRVRPAAAIKDCETRLDPKVLKLALAYKDYEKRGREAGVLDFDSLILEMVEILDKHPDVRSRWTRDWLQLDESQDMSKIEWDLARLVSGKSVLAVGDVSQGIYNFRGSDPRMFANMDQIFPGTKTLFLSANYRSSPEIVDFIRPISATQDLAAQFHTPNSSGPAPLVKGFTNSGDEAAWIVSRIKESRLMDKTVAILARTNRALLPFEQALSAAEISFHYINRSGFFAQAEIQAALAFLGACLYPADYLISGMLRTDLPPVKYLPRTKLISRLKELKAVDDSVSYWGLLTKDPRSLVEPKNLEALQHFVQFVHSLSRYRELPAADALKQVLTSLKAGDHYAEYDSPDSDPLDNLSTLLKMAAKHRNIKEFLDFCRRVLAASKKKSGVALGTIHSAKGLQWTDVYVVGCQEGTLPHAKSTDLDGEKNCFFVGCSRAERELVITYSGAASPFLKTVQIPEKEAV